jgi:hypothetical protein
MGIHYLKEDSQLSSSELNEVDCVEFCCSGVVGLLPNEVFHVHIVVFTEKLEHPERPAHYGDTLLLKCGLFCVIAFYLMISLHHV